VAAPDAALVADKPSRNSAIKTGMSPSRGSGREDYRKSRALRTAALDRKRSRRQAAASKPDQPNGKKARQLAPKAN
jgi:hypothetical protein